MLDFVKNFQRERIIRQMKQEELFVFREKISIRIRKKL